MRLFRPRVTISSFAPGMDWSARREMDRRRLHGRRGGRHLPSCARECDGRDSAIAQTLFDNGRRLMGEGRYADACPKFAESERLESRASAHSSTSPCVARRRGSWRPPGSSTARRRPSPSKQDGRNTKVRGSARGAPRTTAIACDRGRARRGRRPRSRRPARWHSTAARRLGLETASRRRKDAVVAKADGRVPWESAIELASEGDDKIVLVPLLDPLPMNTSSSCRCSRGRRLASRPRRPFLRAHAG